MPTFQGELRLDPGDGIVDWMTEFGQTIDLRYMGSSHVGFMYFERFSKRLMAAAGIGFHIGTALHQGMKRNHM